MLHHRPAEQPQWFEVPSYCHDCSRQFRMELIADWWMDHFFGREHPLCSCFCCAAMRQYMVNKVDVRARIAKSRPISMQWGWPKWRFGHFWPRIVASSTCIAMFLDAFPVWSRSPAEPNLLDFGQHYPERPYRYWVFDRACCCPSIITDCFCAAAAAQSSAVLRAALLRVSSHRKMGLKMSIYTGF